MGSFGVGAASGAWLSFPGLRTFRGSEGGFRKANVPGAGQGPAPDWISEFVAVG